MELFLPSFLILLLASIVVFTVIPRFSIHVLAVISFGLLSFGAYNHWSTFKSEYKLATWHEPLKQIAPAIVLGVMMLFVLSYALSFFGDTGIPVPALPELTAVTNSATSTIGNAVTGIANTVKNVAVGAVNTVGNIASKATNVVSGGTAGLRNTFRRNNNMGFNIGSLPNKLP
jgi:hypothetical protein